jgi:hypothetical protein
MTLQQKRRAMAEACPGIFVILPDGRILWRDTLGLIIEREWLYAVHLAVSLLRGQNQFYFFDYQKLLWEIVTERPHDKEMDYWCSISMFEVTNATESQRIDAWLKVKGLWREGE